MVTMPNLFSMLPSFRSITRKADGWCEQVHTGEASPGAFPADPKPCRQTRRWLRLSGRRPVQGGGGADQGLEGILIQFIALMQIDRAPGVAFKAGVEQS